MLESPHVYPIPETFAMEQSVWAEVFALRNSGTIDIEGLPDSPATWLDEYHKHVLVEVAANILCAQSARRPMSKIEEKLPVIEQMRVANPSAEDALLAETYPSIAC